VGRGDHPHVDPDRVGRADPLELALLQHAEQADLGGHRDVADLVEEDRAAVGRLEEPLLVALRAGEGALHVAEQLRLEERLGERPAVERDERVAAAGAPGVQGARDELLARAALARDEHGGGAVGHRLDHADHLAHRRGAAHEALRRAALALAQLALQLAVAVEQGLALGGLGDGTADDLDVVERLRQVVVRAGADGGERGLHRRVAGHHDDLDLGPAVLHGVQELEARQLRHLDVEQGDVEVLLRELLGGGDGRVEPDHVVALLAQERLERAQQRRLVVDDEDAGGLHFGGLGHVVLLGVRCG